MKKPLAGKRAFYAQGQRAAARGNPDIPGEVRKQMPDWAHTAWSKGYWSRALSAVGAAHRRYVEPKPTLVIIDEWDFSNAPIDKVGTLNNWDEQYVTYPVPPPPFGKSWTLK